MTVEKLIELLKTKDQTLEVAIGGPGRFVYPVKGAIVTPTRPSKYSTDWYDRHMLVIE